MGAEAELSPNMQTTVIKRNAAGKRGISGTVKTSAISTPSPFRYPGGKSWLAPYVRQWVRSLNGPVHFVEPFAGGANVGLTLVLEQLVEQLTLVELDKDVASVWSSVLNGHSTTLAKRILQFKMTRTGVLQLLKTHPRSQLDRAFMTLVKNRVRRGGILNGTASLLKSGENGNGIRSRWYPETLKKRIEAIAKSRARITFLNQDGLRFMREHATDEHLAFFLDPPYTIAGERLYAHSEIDHRSLFKLTSSIAGNVLLTYDNTAEIRGLAREFGFQAKRIRMRTSHHFIKTELLIGRDLTWLDRRKL